MLLDQHRHPSLWGRGGNWAILLESVDLCLVSALPSNVQTGHLQPAWTLTVCSEVLEDPT